MESSEWGCAVNRGPALNCSRRFSSDQPSQPGRGDCKTEAERRTGLAFWTTRRDGSLRLMAHVSALHGHCPGCVCLSCPAVFLRSQIQLRQ